MIATLVLFAAAMQHAAVERAAARIELAQYCAAVERRAQHREVDRVQPVSILEPELARAQHLRDLARLVQ